MFSLLYGLWEYVWRKEELRILILGLDKAGKTSLLEKLKVGSLTSLCIVHALRVQWSKCASYAPSLPLNFREMQPLLCCYSCAHWLPHCHLVRLNIKTTPFADISSVPCRMHDVRGVPWTSHSMQVDRRGREMKP